MRTVVAVLLLSLFGSACASTSKDASTLGTSASAAPEGAAAPTSSAIAPSGDGAPAGAGGGDGGAGAPAAGQGPGSGGGGGVGPAAGRASGDLAVGVRFIDTASVAAAAALFGLSGASVGDPKGYAEAMIGDINRRGGLFGRKIVPTFHAVDAVELAVNSASAEEKACRAFTEDAKVALVVSPGPTNQAFMDCTTKKKLPVINASYNYFTPSLMRTYGQYFHFPVGMDATSSARALVDGLRAAGYFGKGYKLGLVMLDRPVYHNVLNESLLPALRKHGLSLHERVALENAQDSAGFSSAVLRFKTADVTHVIFLESAGQMALGFTEQAENQNYRPRYGFSSHASMVGIRENVNPSQLVRSVGVGWVRASDAIGPKGVEVDDTGRSCQSTLRAAGEEIADNGALTMALWVCDTFRYLDALTETGAAPTAAGLAGGVAKLGSSFRPSSTFKTAFPGARRDGASVVRRFVYESGCRCFRWSGAPYAAR